MGLRINQNIMAFSAYRNLTVTDGQLGKSLEKLSSGFRINRAADDAAGLVISENLRSQVGGLRVASRNAQDGISVVQTAEGALNEVEAVLQRMRDLAVQAANTGSNDSTARAAAQQEVQALSAEIDRIASSTKFGNLNLLDGTFGAGAVVTQATITGATVAGAASVDFNASNGAFFVRVNPGAGQQGTWVTVNLTTDWSATAGATVASDLQTAINDALGGGTAVAVSGTGTGATLELTVALSGSVAGASLELAVAPGGNNALARLGLADGTAQGVSATTTSTGTSGVFQVGANTQSTDQIQVVIGAVSASSLTVDSLDVTTAATAAIDTIDTAIQTVSSRRGALGAIQNRFEHTIANLNVATENLAASESRIRDTDMALEMVSFTRHQILMQAGTAMLAQANVAPQSVLRLLQL